MNRIGYVAIVAIAALPIATGALAQDRREVVPEMNVLLENDCVRVQDHDVAVGGKIPVHSHPNYVVYTLEPFAARITLADGSTRIGKHGAGEAYWNEPITHAVENTGKAGIHNLIIELKPGASCHEERR